MSQRPSDPRLSSTTAPHSPKKPLIIPDRAAQRAATNYTEDEKGCFISNYSVGSHGYAQVGWQNSSENEHRGVTAHRAAWVYAHGEQIPLGMTVDHLCKEKRCVNPDHLRLLSNFENARRTDGRDWPLGQCAKGHSNKHLYRQAEGRWRCRLCNDEYQRRYREKKRARHLTRPGSLRPKGRKS